MSQNTGLSSTLIVKTGFSSTPKRGKISNFAITCALPLKCGPLLNRSHLGCHLHRRVLSRVSQAWSIALEKVRAQNIARQGTVSDAPPGLGALPRAAGMTQAALKASISRYLPSSIPPRSGDGPPHDDGSVSRASRAADAPGRPSRLAGGYERVGVGPPGGTPPMVVMTRAMAAMTIQDLMTRESNPLILFIVPKSVSPIRPLSPLLLLPTLTAGGAMMTRDLLLPLRDGKPLAKRRKIKRIRRFPRQRIRLSKKYVTSR